MNEQTNGIGAVEQVEENADRTEETTLLQDVLRSIRRERERDAEKNGEYTNYPYESYSMILKLMERKDEVSKDLKDCLKSLWDGVKREDEDVVAAFCGEISRVARESAMAWVQVAAMADKAQDSV